jgi:hypothetical protein
MIKEVPNIIAIATPLLGLPPLFGVHVMIKKAVDDRRRARADQRANQRMVRIVRNVQLVEVIIHSIH